MRMFPRNISAKTLFFILGIIVIIHLSFLISYTTTHRNTLENLDRSTMLQKVYNIIHIALSNKPEHRAQAITAIEDPSIHATISEKPVWPIQTDNLLSWSKSPDFRSHVHDFKLSLLVAPQTWLNLHADVTNSPNYSHWLLIILETIIAIILLSSSWSLHRVTEPLTNFKRAADRLGIDLDPEPIIENGPAIVRETAFAINKMQERINDLIWDRTQILAAISHDLFTPITRLKLRMQFVENEEIRTKAESDLEQIEHMISEILSLIRTEAQKEAPINIELNEFLHNICEEFSDMGCDVVFTPSNKSLLFHGRNLALKRAFSNLINNAIKYGKRARVAITETDPNTIITIEDDGPGIPESEHENVFTPFYRGEYSRSRDTGGTGLGMTITRDILFAHGGKIKLYNRPDGGFTVTVTI